MNFKIKDISELSANFIRQKQNGGEEFQKAVEDALSANNNALSKIYSDSKGFVAISPKYEKKLLENPELAEEIVQKINNMYKNFGKNTRDNVIVIDKNGEIAQYCMKPDKNRPDHPTPEELKEAAKARARKKARLDAYFRLLERISIKRKLIEQENAKRIINKKYRYSVSKLNCIAQSISQYRPPKDPEYYL